MQTPWLNALRGRLPEVAFILICLIVAALDAVLGRHICPWVLYFVPVGVSGWLMGARFSLGLAGLCTLLILGVGLLVGHPFEAMSYFLFSVFNRAVGLSLVGYLAAEAGRAQVLRSIVRSYEEQT